MCVCAKICKITFGIWCKILMHLYFWDLEIKEGNKAICKSGDEFFYGNRTKKRANVASSVADLISSFNMQDCQLLWLLAKILIIGNTGNNKLTFAKCQSWVRLFPGLGVAQSIFGCDTEQVNSVGIKAINILERLVRVGFHSSIPWTLFPLSERKKWRRR